MIDFLTHIIPNIDDGSRGIEETFNLIKESKEAGFEGIVLASHYKEGYYETAVAERDIWVKVIADNLRNKGIETNLYLGNEIFITDNMMKLLMDGKASTINNSSYVLIELPVKAKINDIYEVIYSLQENKLIPIITHPERYRFIQKNPNIMYDLISDGVLFQANYGSILGQYGTKAEITVRKLLEANMIHFLGTDVHRENTIYKVIPDALNEIRKIVGKDQLEILSDINPRLAIANKKIGVEEPEQITLTFKEKLIMNLKRD